FVVIQPLSRELLQQILLLFYVQLFYQGWSCVFFFFFILTRSIPYFFSCFYLRITFFILCIVSLFVAFIKLISFLFFVYIYFFVFCLFFFFFFYFNQLAINILPLSVITDSGWNCRPRTSY